MTGYLGDVELGHDGDRLAGGLARVDVDHPGESRDPLRSRRSATVLPLVRKKPWSAIHSSL